MRVCKNCGRYFAVAGHGGTEYCSRLFDSKGRTCKEIGAVTQWGKSKDAMLCSRSTAGSTSGGLCGSSLAELIRKSSMPGARHHREVGAVRGRAGHHVHHPGGRQVQRRL